MKQSQQTVGQRERATQNRVVELFKNQLEYDYLGSWEERDGNANIEEDLLRDFLAKQGHSEEIINKVIFQFTKAATDQSNKLYFVNQETYSLLRYGVTVKPEAGQNKQTIYLIDWKTPENNHFAIAEEVTVTGEHDKRPDIVMYVNGIALGVIELKRSTVSVSEGIRQNLDNQKKEFIQSFYTTMQLVMAGNDTEGLKYGTIETPERYYLSWKEESEVENPLDRSLLQLCEKSRFLEIIHDFVVFDSGVKKVCRQNQYFGIKAAQEYIGRREGGIIWHTQGSGKSLSMVWLTKWIKEYSSDSRVLIITDRDELDEQIEKVFKGVNEKIHRTKSGRDLIKVLNSTTPSLICSLVHKFGKKSEADYDGFLDDIQNSLPSDFKAKGNIFVLVDECHRTQSGKLHNAMKKLLPDALFIGFTGTPLLKKDKQKSLEVFGTYIHTYKFDEAVKDEVVLDLRYEARAIDQDVTSQEKIDQWFDAKTRGLTDVAKGDLKKRWGTMRKVLSSQSRLEKIVADILLDFETKDRLASGRGNAMLVSGSIYQACRYYELFQQAGFTKCAIITSYKPNIADIKGESTGEDALTEKLQKYDVYQKMLGGKDPETFEEEVKEIFIEEPAQMKLLIVVDKLLTGFDAPPATYLFIDKKMRDHGLFQAICRVNRLDGDDKEYGYIVDYQDLFKSLDRSIKDYTSEAFDDYEASDVAGLLEDRIEKAKERLEETLETMRALCEPVEPPKDTPQYIQYFCGNTEDKNDLVETEQKRVMLYKQTSSLVRAFANLANEMVEAGYTPEQTEKIREEVKHYESVRQEIKLASGDYIDLKLYEPAMRHLIDRYLGAGESRVVSSFEDMTLVDLVVKEGVGAFKKLPSRVGKKKEAVAETIENNVRKLITDETPSNPKYYERMSILLDELIKKRKSEAQSYEEYMEAIVELTKQVKNPGLSAEYPKSLNTNAKRALFDNLHQDEDLALKLDKIIMNTKKDGWRGNKVKEREIKAALNQEINNVEEVERIFDLVKNQHDY